MRYNPSGTPLRVGLLLAALSLLAPGARAQSSVQVFINSMWVSSPGANCVFDNTQGPRFFCEGPPNAVCPTSSEGNISNNPHIEFDVSSSPACGASPFPSGSSAQDICNAKVFLCTNVGFSNLGSSNTGFALDFVNFELFKFGQGSNPLDPGSTPPLRTFFIDSPGSVPTNSSGTIPTGQECTNIGLPSGCGYCVLWDGSINILGEFGKSDGQYGFRSTVETNQVSATAGNIKITQTRAYPGGSTKALDGSASCSAGSSAGTVVEQKPITVDVTNLHAVRSSPTVVGTVTGVAAEPYNITYRLSKDATMFLTIDVPGGSLVRTIVPGLPRAGEGVPDGTLQNGDAWNGRHANGDLMPPGLYLATLQAIASDQFGFDLSAATTRQLSLDPLQVTDILVQPLTNQSTSLAVLTYTLTEPATSFVDIYPPGTQFCRGLNGLNNTAIIPDRTGASPKDFGASLGGCAGTTPLVPVSPVRSIVEQKDLRRAVVTFWDGRDGSGGLMADGDYVFVLYAALPSQNGVSFNASTTDLRIWTSVAKSGFATVARGFVSISQVGPSSTVIGSNPAVAGLNPFIFSYSLSRDAVVTMRILNAAGTSVKRTLVRGEVRPGNFLNREIWADGIGDDGLFVSSGNYLVELAAADPFFPSKVSTTTALFPLDLFRITDVASTQLLTGATDVVTLNYQLSQGMNLAWNIYPQNTQILGSSATWPPCGSLQPGVCAQTVVGGTPVAPFLSINGMRPGRLRITEFWDGRDTNGLFVPDGTYVFTLVARSTTAPSFFASDRIFGTLTVARGSVVFPTFTVKPTVPTLFNSTQTITLPPFDISYSLTRQSSVTIRILDTAVPPNLVRTVISGQIRDANVLNQDFWDGRNDRGNFVSSGFYIVQAVAQDLASTLSSGSTVQQTVAVDPLRIYDVAVGPLTQAQGTSSALISYQVSETMKTSVKIFKPGTSFDPNGNPTPPESVSLVRRIVGVRPARTEINEVWDGRDEKLALVPDGNYIFRIVGSTDSTAIDSITGDVVAGASLAEDLIIAEVPVVRGESVDPEKDFEQNTFVYPNPVSGAQANFEIFVPFQSDVSLKIFTITGDLVFERQFSNQPRSTDNGPLRFTWGKVNSSNKSVAPGVYFALIRETETRGGSNLLQTVKKILIQ